ncbi:hypothetical protein QBC47DRAFT_402000 [Echria macrotheca]|uniref:Uncharacterized protein n=1 Tax=Echria macrotheca TaxID=438768 RepID=A0AAJ0BD51_9PEZI|nr:hypothetical protein QBC47DRAFT_402000 [Echria macrotheca]
MCQSELIKFTCTHTITRLTRPCSSSSGPLPRRCPLPCPPSSLPTTTILTIPDCCAKCHPPQRIAQIRRRYEDRKEQIRRDLVASDSLLSEALYLLSLDPSSATTPEEGEDMLGRECEEILEDIVFRETERGEELERKLQGLDGECRGEIEAFLKWVGEMERKGETRFLWREGEVDGEEGDGGVFWPGKEEFQGRFWNALLGEDGTGQERPDLMKAVVEEKMRQRERMRDPKGGLVQLEALFQ